MQSIIKEVPIFCHLYPKLKATPPILILTAAVAIPVFQTFGPKWNESYREMLGRWTLRIPALRNRYQEEMKKNSEKFQKEWEERFQQFGEEVTEIPLDGYTLEQLFEVIERYDGIVKSELEEAQLSGTVYPPVQHSDFKRIDAPFETLDHRIQTLYNQIFPEVFRISCLWNSLHFEEFGVGLFIERQVVKMIADLYSSEPVQVQGAVTTGGTESLMMAARAYRNKKGLEPGQSVIIAPRSIHAGLVKAGEDYQIRIIYVDTDEQGRVIPNEVKSLMKEHKKDLIAVFLSTPSYPTGVIDPIEEIADYANKIECGLHVDCCLGGFIHIRPYLNLPGVTSLSCDTHKNGFAPKGSSVLVTKDDIYFHGIYSIPNWQGGVYGSPTAAGSRPSAPALLTFLALLALGKNGYRQVQEKITSTINDLNNRLTSDDRFLNKIEVISSPEVNVIAFRIHPSLGLNSGASYALAYCMKENGFVLNSLKGDRVHLCVTYRFASKDGINDRFLQALERAIEKVLTLESFLGDAAIYGSLSSAEHPDPSEIGLLKSIENYLFGLQGARDTVKTYFEAMFYS